MALTLYSHPLSSYCWKVLIALYENGTPFNARMVNLGDPEEGGIQDIVANRENSPS